MQAHRPGPGGPGAGTFWDWGQTPGKVDALVTCPSGRRCNTRNVVWRKSQRGFKSHRHRQPRRSRFPCKSREPGPSLWSYRMYLAKNWQSLSDAPFSGRLRRCKPTRSGSAPDGEYPLRCPCFKSHRHRQVKMTPVKGCSSNNLSMSSRRRFRVPDGPFDLICDG